MDKGSLSSSSEIRVSPCALVYIYNIYNIFGFSWHCCTCGNPLCNGPRVQTEGGAHIHTHIWYRALMSVKARQTYRETFHIAMESIMIILRNCYFSGEKIFREWWRWFLMPKLQGHPFQLLLQTALNISGVPTKLRTTRPPVSTLAALEAYHVCINKLVWDNLINHNVALPSAL